jgi:4-oxalocrotonate tautomerase
MPLVKIDLIEGKSIEQKNDLIKEISNSFKIIGIPSDKVHVILNEIKKENWGFDGVPATVWMDKDNTKVD